MLSPGVLQMLDQVRSEFGVEVEIVDATLSGAWTHEGERAPRVLAAPELHAVGLGVLREGRATVATVEGRRYRLVPLRSGRSVSPAALMAMRVSSAAPLGRQEDSERFDIEPWVEVLRGAIEADLSSREDLDGERQQARAVRGALKFVTYLASATTAQQVAEAAIQAAAVWFDADARVYRRQPSGAFALVASLPGAGVPAEGRVLSEIALGLDGPFVRPTPLAAIGAGRESLVVPMVTAGPADWALILLGPVPADADVTLEALGRVLGVQMERLALARTVEGRRHFEEILVRGERPIELTALDVLRELVSSTGGIGAAIWVQHGHDVRRIAAVGAGMASPQTPLVNEGAGLADEFVSSAALLVRSFHLGIGRRARLEIRAASDAPFGADAPLVTDACASVLRAWLPAAVGPVPETSPLLIPSVVADFALRLEEELARAKRFDRDLALVVVESGVLPWSQDTVDRLVDVLRGELRGSDVLGMIGERRLVVLLIETHRSGVGIVVRRLRDRLGRAIPELKIPALVLGQAAFSTECSTADALLSQAVVNAETITVPA
jgi:hypothetical protein